MPAGGAAGSAAASAGSCTSTVSPAWTRWRLGTAAPSTRTAPSSMSRCARAREPSGPARNASSRAPASSAPARRRIVALEDVQQDEHAEGDRHVGDVERREAERQLHEVGDAAAPGAVYDVADRAAEQHPGRQPEQRPAHVRGEVDEQQRERDRHHDRHDRPAARERAERHAGVARVDDLDAREDGDPLALVDRRADERLRRLVERDDGRGHEGDPPPGAESHGPQPWIRRTTMPPMMFSTKIAMIGLRSNGPIDGMNRRKIDRYGSQTSRRNPSTALDHRAYGTRPPNAKNIELRM